MFVCLFAVNAKTTARIDAKCSGITKNDPESVLCVLKSPVLVFLGRYRDISGFSFAVDRHFYFSHFHFRFLCRRLTTQSAFVKRVDRAPHRYCFIAKGNFTSRTKMLLLLLYYVMCAKNVFILRHYLNTLWPWAYFSCPTLCHQHS